MTYTPTRAIDVIEQINTPIHTFVFEFGGIAVEARTAEEARRLVVEHIKRLGVEEFVNQAKLYRTESHPF